MERELKIKEEVVPGLGLEEVGMNLGWVPFNKILPPLKLGERAGQCQWDEKVQSLSSKGSHLWMDQVTKWALLVAWW